MTISHTVVKIAQMGLANGSTTINQSALWADSISY